MFQRTDKAFQHPHANVQPAGMPVLPKYWNEVLSAIVFVESNLKAPIRVQDVCRAAAISDWHFQRIFRSCVGDSIGSYLRGRRLTEAAEIIMEKPKTSLLDIALEFQFGSHEAFSRSFRSYFGFSPSQIVAQSGAYLSKRKVPLDQGRLETVWRSIDFNFRNQQIGPLDVVGVCREVASPFSDEDEFQSETEKAWQDFHRLGRPIFGNDLFVAPSLGIALNTKDQLVSSKMLYLAGKIVSSDSAPAYLDENFRQIRLPQSNYAVFSIEAGLREVELMVDFIYGIWLPNSDFSRGDGYDFESFDFKRQMQTGLINYTYHLPVQTK